MIRIGNLRKITLAPNEVLIKIDRTSVLGNPFYMADESKRDMVCEKYKAYFVKKLADKDQVFIRALRDIYDTMKDHDVVLGCWCAPKRCHGETIINFINQQIVKAKMKGGE